MPGGNPRSQVKIDLTLDSIMSVKQQGSFTQLSKQLKTNRNSIILSLVFVRQLHLRGPLRRTESSTSFSFHDIASKS